MPQEEPLTYTPDQPLELAAGGTFAITVPDAGFDVPLRFIREPEEEEARVTSTDGSYEQTRAWADGVEDGEELILIFNGIEVGKTYALHVTPKGGEPYCVAQNVEATRDDIVALWEEERARAAGTHDPTSGQQPAATTDSDREAPESS